MGLGALGREHSINHPPIFTDTVDTKTFVRGAFVWRKLPKANSTESEGTEGPLCCPISRLV